MSPQAPPAAAADVVEPADAGGLADAVAPQCRAGASLEGESAQVLSTRNHFFAHGQCKCKSGCLTWRVLCSCLGRVRLNFARAGGVQVGPGLIGSEVARAYKAVFLLVHAHQFACMNCIHRPSCVASLCQCVHFIGLCFLPSVDLCIRFCRSRSARSSILSHTELAMVPASSFGTRVHPSAARQLSPRRSMCSFMCAPSHLYKLPIVFWIRIRLWSGRNSIPDVVKARITVRNPHRNGSQNGCAIAFLCQENC